MEKWTKEEGEAFTLNDWDRAHGERGRQRCYGRRDKWKTIDVSWMVWEKTARGREGLRLGRHLQRADSSEMKCEHRGADSYSTI